jgi:hypothetical protein
MSIKNQFGKKCVGHVYTNLLLWSGSVHEPHVVKTTVSGKYNYLNYNRTRRAAGSRPMAWVHSDGEHVCPVLDHLHTRSTHFIISPLVLAKVDSHHRESHSNLALCFNSNVNTSAHGQGTVWSRAGGSCYNRSLVTRTSLA